VLEIFHSFDFNKKHLRQSLKPFDFDCLLKLSQSQLQESAFKVGVVESALEVVVEIMNSHVSSSAFPELAFLCCSQLKSFCHSSRNPSLSRPVKELSDKISEHASWLEQRRLASALNLTNEDNSVTDFESGIASSNESPFGKYYETFKTMKERERKLRQDTAADGDETKQSDDEEETIQPRKKRKVEKAKQSSKKVEKKKAPIDIRGIGDDEDLVEDLNLSDLD